ncbi:MAG: cob(I)yrinic acid a,c-diamide adenosyltransferase [Candidatus Omnitrophica bacterium]|nr:cob(I)yrinic acid a,c-diamide adenosyltransferase [Candidatus Gastranaerophilales bacterium]MDD5070413.1 cob(I)yrinic acid a,c-diamide adenosyltransferase [Candidatus Omnitrophota bacterium]
MGITTKTGDNGLTSLYGGLRVKKDSPLVELCGTLDEVVSFLGLSKELSSGKKIRNLLSQIQKQLLIVCGEISLTISVGRTVKSSGQIKKSINSEDCDELEKFILLLEKNKSKKIKNFNLPPSGLKHVYFDVCRVLVRRAERRFVTAGKIKNAKNTVILRYFNRLSDLLYLLSRGYRL